MFVTMLLLNRSERPSERAPPVVGKINTKFTDLIHLRDSENLLDSKTGRKNLSYAAFKYWTNYWKWHALFFFLKLATHHNMHP